MKSKKDTFAGMIALACLIALSIYTLAIMAQSRIKRTDLQQHDLSILRREVIQTRVDFQPGEAFGNHLHPGEEIVYVIEGVLEYQIDSGPPVTLKSGEVLFIPAQTVHAAKNVGTTNGAELATYIVEKGKPLVVMVK